MERMAGAGFEEQPVEKRRRIKEKNNNNSCLFLYHFFQLSLGLPKWQVVDDDDVRRTGYKNQPPVCWTDSLILEREKGKGGVFKKNKGLQVEAGFKENENE